MIDPTNKSQPKNKIPYYAIIDIYRFSFFLLFFLNTNQSLRPRTHGQRRQVINNNGNELIFAGRRQFFFLDFLFLVYSTISTTICSTNEYTKIGFLTICEESQFAGRPPVNYDMAGSWDSTLK